MNNYIHLNIVNEKSTTMNKKNRYYIYKCIILIILILIVIISYIEISSKSIPFNKFNLQNDEDSDRVLVIYVYANTHLLSKSNLDYFIRVGIRKSSNADYYIIVQQINNTYVDENNLLKLPSYAHYIQHENKCFDLGTIGWFISTGKININNYKYFIFLNSSVRGPYLVTYYNSKQWYHAFIRRINNYTKLVGPTISCQSSPHVQSYFWATDQIGLEILLKDGNIFKCHETQVNTIYHAEIPASRIMFMAGFSIDSLMKKYEGVDFRKVTPPGCYHHDNPTSDKKVDGISLDPFEVVFVKLKYTTTDYQHIQSRISVYDKWIQ